MKDCQYVQQKYMVNTYANRQLTFIKGEGAFLIDENGEQFLDLMSNYGVNIFGYNHPILTKALVSQLQRITTLHGSFISDVRAEASEVLVKRCGEAYEQIYWSNSGAEAIEAALKFSVLKTGKRKFIVADHGYHGKTLGALSATAGEKYKKPFEPLLWEFIKIPFNDSSALKNAIDANTAGFIIEPIQGEGGIFIPDPKYLQQVKKICAQNGILLIIDEIQTGMGRTGTFLASEGIAGDILCLGKGLAGGVPVGATVISHDVSQFIQRGIHTSTFGGNPLACAGTVATLGLLSAQNLTYVKNIGKYFINRLRLVKSPFIKAIRGKGLMIGIEVQVEKRNEILKLLQKENILVIPAGENVVRLLPPFILKEEHVDIAVSKLQKILNTLS